MLVRHNQVSMLQISDLAVAPPDSRSGTLLLLALTRGRLGGVPVAYKKPERIFEICFSPLATILLLLSVQVPLFDFLYFLQSDFCSV